MSIVARENPASRMRAVIAAQNLPLGFPRRGAAIAVLTAIRCCQDRPFGRGGDRMPVSAAQGGAGAIRSGGGHELSGAMVCTASRSFTDC